MYHSSTGYILTERDLQEHQDFVRENYSDLSKLNPADCSVITFSRVKPPDRWSTRVGGLPAWPRDEDWPACGECDEPLAFVAQFDFRKTPLRQNVPRDVLLFHFCFSCRPWQSDNPASLLTWRDVNNESLVEEAIVPDELEDDEPGPCYGTLHPVTDYSQKVGDQWTGPDELNLMATKIGGYPPEIQPLNPPLESDGNAMKFLACLGSIRGQDIPKPKQRTEACGDLVWGDMGCVLFWLGKSTTGFETDWNLTCY